MRLIHPFPDKGMLLRGIGGSQIYVTQASTHLGNQDHEFWSVAQN